MALMSIFIMPNSTSILPNLEIKNYFGNKFGKLEFLCRIRLSNSPFGFLPNSLPIVRMVFLKMSRKGFYLSGPEWNPFRPSEKFYKTGPEELGRKGVDRNVRNPSVHISTGNGSNIIERFLEQSRTVHGSL